MPVVTVKNVPVASKKLRSEMVPVAADKIFVFKEEPVAFKNPSVVFTNKFVAVELPNDPRESDRVVPVAPVKDKFVVVTVEALTVPMTFNVPVTDDEAATKPPNNWTVVVVKLPRAETLWRVSVSDAATQFVPSERQTETKVSRPKPSVPITVDEAPSANGRTKLTELEVLGDSRLM